MSMSSPRSSARPLPQRQLLAYGALGLPLAMAALPVYVHVPRLYAEISGMSLSLLGVLLLVYASPTPASIRCLAAGATAQQSASA